MFTNDNNTTSATSRREQPPQNVAVRVPGYPLEMLSPFKRHNMTSPYSACHTAMIPPPAQHHDLLSGSIHAEVMHVTHHQATTRQSMVTEKRFSGYFDDSGGTEQREKKRKVDFANIDSLRWLTVSAVADLKLWIFYFTNSVTSSKWGYDGLRDCLYFHYYEYIWSLWETRGYRIYGITADDEVVSKSLARRSPESNLFVCLN